MSDQTPLQTESWQPEDHARRESRPRAEMRDYRGADRLVGKVALVSGGDSGIGRAVAVGFAKEGADVAFTYVDAHEDAQETMRLIQAAGRQTLALSGDIGQSAFCADVVEQVVQRFERIDVLVNNACEQQVREAFEDISDAQLEHTFRINIFGQFFLARAALPHLRDGSAIVNTTSVVAYRGSASLVDFAATSGAIVSFTRALSLALTGRGIRVNAVAPGQHGQPDEIAPSYVFLASSDARYMTGQVLHPNGGAVVNG